MSEEALFYLSTLLASELAVWEEELKGRTFRNVSTLKPQVQVVKLHISDVRANETT